MIERKTIKALPSSFVASNMKLATDRGAGEAKLWVGQTSNAAELDEFFAFNDDTYTYSFVRENLLEYLDQVKIEYVYQKFNNYKDASLATWNSNQSQIKEMEDDEFQIHLTKYTDATRYYVRADEDIFKKVFRKLAVPKLTNVVFVKDNEKKSIRLTLELNLDYDSGNIGDDNDSYADVLEHNLYGIHIKGKNDALSDERPHVCIGWSSMGDLTGITSREELDKKYSEVWPNEKPRAKGQDVGQIWRFINDMQKGDYVIFADGEVCHIGRVTTDYYYDNKAYDNQDPDYINVRDVEWLKKDVLRSSLSSVLHHSLATSMSIWAMNDYRASILDLLLGTYVKDEDLDVEDTVKDGLVYNTGFKSLKPRNRIIFGAPGTGKSFKLNEERKELLGENNEANYERVTFHPDYSYANFVGTYKPVMTSNKKTAVDKDTDYVISILNDNGKTAQEKYDVLFEKFKDDGLTRLPVLLGLYTDEMFKTRKQDGTDAAGDNSVERNHGKAIRKYVSLLTGQETSSDIAYEYVPGPFMRVYVNALKSARSGNPKPYLLIIEEINRANVAAVFGDVFQLLDRDENEVSEYPIQASEDIKKYLAKELGGNPEDYNKIKIPDNMFIWATMNSADQGVFPMDTAFKRRWDFTYIGIDDNDDEIRGKYVVLGNKASQKVEWNKLRKAINRFLAKQKINEDKQLGPYFLSRKVVVPKSGDEIDKEEFCKAFKNKVIMYLFEDAAKQKRPSLFEGCFDSSSRYSEICKEFDEKGVGIFNHEIGLDTDPEDIKVNGKESGENAEETE